jgi:hypothetical protein
VCSFDVPRSIANRNITLGATGTLRRKNSDSFLAANGYVIVFTCLSHLRSGADRLGLVPDCTNHAFPVIFGRLARFGDPAVRRSDPGFPRQSSALESFALRRNLDVFSSPPS